MDSPDHTLYICSSCWQAFVAYGDWHDHANGPYATVVEAERDMVEVSPGAAIPAGVRLGERKCFHHGGPEDPVAYQDIEEGDVVWRDTGERYVGTVGHRDDNILAVEKPDGDTVSISREECHPNGEYRVIRL